MLHGPLCPHRRVQVVFLLATQSLNVLTESILNGLATVVLNDQVLLFLSELSLWLTIDRSLNDRGLTEKVPHEPVRHIQVVDELLGSFCGEDVCWLHEGECMHRPLCLSRNFLTDFLDDRTIYLMQEIDELAEEALMNGPKMTEPHNFQCVDNEGRTRLSRETFELEEVMKSWEAASTLLAARVEDKDFL